MTMPSVVMMPATDNNEVFYRLGRHNNESIDRIVHHVQAHSIQADNIGDVELCEILTRADAAEEQELWTAQFARR